MSRTGRGVDRREALARLVAAGRDPIEAAEELGYARPVEAARRAGYSIASGVDRIKAARVVEVEAQAAEPESTHVLAHRRIRSIITDGADPQAISAAKAALDHKLASDAAGISTDNGSSARVVLVVVDNGRGPTPAHTVTVDSVESAHELLAFVSGSRERVRAVVIPRPERVIEIVADSELTPVTEVYSPPKVLIPELSSHV